MLILNFVLLFIGTIVIYNASTLLDLVLDANCIRLDSKLASRLNENTFELLSCIELVAQSKIMHFNSVMFTHL